MNFAKEVEPSKQDVHIMFNLCRKDDWKTVLRHVNANPLMGLSEMTMDNHIKTTIIHQAITSKSKISDRALVIQTVLKLTPKAATIKNGYGSLPLHVICQRNTKMNSRIKETLIYDLIKAFPQGLNEEGGVGRRTPLHIAFTDYISPQLAQFMINKGMNAISLRDKKLWLPIHVACSRHCSPEKLNMLLEANPSSLFAKTGDGKSLMDLAKETATKSHPNFALIAELERHLELGGGATYAEATQSTIAVRSPDSTPDGREVASPRLGRKKRKRGECTDDVADLLLHFSRYVKSPRDDDSMQHSARSPPVVQQVTPMSQSESTGLFYPTTPLVEYRSFYPPQRNVDPFYQHPSSEQFYPTQHSVDPFYQQDRNIDPFYPQQHNVNQWYVQDSADQNYHHEPQQNYHDQPQQNYHHEPQQNYHDQPQQNYHHEPQQNYHNQPQLEQQLSVDTSYMGQFDGYMEQV